MKLSCSEHIVKAQAAFPELSSAPQQALLVPVKLWEYLRLSLILHF